MHTVDEAAPRWNNASAELQTQVADTGLERLPKGLGEMQGAGARRGLAEPRADQREDARRVRRMQLAVAAGRRIIHARKQCNPTSGTGARRATPVDFAVSSRAVAKDGVPLAADRHQFPRRDYERLLEAQERAEPPPWRAVPSGAVAAGGRDHPKLRRPSHRPSSPSCSLPTEGLYAGLRRPVWREALQREPRDAHRPDHAAGHAGAACRWASALALGAARRCGSAGRE